ncbi:hypothetical protein PHLCEN_2v12836 [Hermanssonia centrifuga]|uniref:Uncharacterized protein n=1 Tax=Hermanssonia centrifuga TaxID=98765 RepID=A0A2R6NH56_9APHY|nr:hypothetical protein PHLCEN_2v12836 [Hermanssonia centrifuga]
MEEIQDHPLLSTPSSSTYETIQGLNQDDLAISGTLVLSGLPDDHVPAFSPVTSVPSSLHRADLLLLSTLKSSLSTLRTLPVSPYPVQAGTPVRAHFVVHQEPEEEGWRPWVGGTWSKWVKGTVLGYRDMAGQEAKPGTYDALSHLLFKPLPTPGSSGGPIVDEETGAIVGVIVGTRMDSQIDGLRGWGRPAETIFELLGLNLNDL